MTSFALVVICFDRLESVKRLVSSLFLVDYLGDTVDLIISIDHSGNDDIATHARTLNWPYGHLRVIAHPERLGLREHVLRCGEITKEYAYICVLEDDLYVSPGMYAFCTAAIDRYGADERIAGISLYSHQWNPYVDAPFSPVDDGYDAYLLQVASSWGQVWGTTQWSHFTAWLSGKSDADLHDQSLPEAVSNWSSKSWLKFHNRYLTYCGRYFLYPKHSLTTNFSDKGEHSQGTATYQVPLLTRSLRNYRFPDSIADFATYDSFFENVALYNAVGFAPIDLTVSLYGNRIPSSRYYLSTRQLPFEIVRSFGLRMRPIEMNILHSIPGKSIFLYDTNTAKPQKKSWRTSYEHLLYQIKMSSRRKIVTLAWFTIRAWLNAMVK